MKTCTDLTPLGQAECKKDVFATAECVWLQDNCLIKSALLSDFESKVRDFTTVTPLGHSETADVFMVLTKQKGYVFDKIMFDFAANKKEVTFNTRLTAGKVVGTPYKFTYEAADIDNDTMQIELKGTAAIKGMVFMVNNVDVVEPFERSLLLYQKSTGKLYFLLVYKKSDMSKFSVRVPADFIIDKGVADSIKDRNSEPHTALIFTE